MRTSSWPAWSRYLIAAGLVSLAFAARMALHPVFAHDHAYTVFYPVVILAAYFLGPRPAILAILSSAFIAYFVFASPTLAFKFQLSPLLTLGFFVMTSSVSTYFITGMARAVRDRAASQARAEELAESHAALFNELNERVANHLQLVAAVLQLQARDEPDGAVAKALTEASARTLLISRTHRSLGEVEGETLDFESFVRSLLGHTLTRRGGELDIDLDLAGVRLPADQATSVAVVLLDCVKTRLAAGGPARLRISMREDDDGLRLSVVERDPSGPFAPKPMLVEAMVEQLCGQFLERYDTDSATSELIFPRTPQAEIVPAAATLH